MEAEAAALVTIVNKWGLHAKASFAMASMAAGFEARITVEKGDMSADAKKMDELLILCAGPGDGIRIKAEGPGARRAVDNLVRLVRSGFGEP